MQNVNIRDNELLFLRRICAKFGILDACVLKQDEFGFYLGAGSSVNSFATAVQTRVCSLGSLMIQGVDVSDPFRVFNYQIISTQASNLCFEYGIGKMTFEAFETQFSAFMMRIGVDFSKMIDMVDLGVYHYDFQPIPRTSMYYVYSKAEIEMYRSMSRSSDSSESEDEHENEIVSVPPEMLNVIHLVEDEVVDCPQIFEGKNLSSANVEVFDDNVKLVLADCISETQVAICAKQFLRIVDPLSFKKCGGCAEVKIATLFSKTQFLKIRGSCVKCIAEKMCLVSNRDLDYQASKDRQSRLAQYCVLHDSLMSIDFEVSLETRDRILEMGFCYVESCCGRIVVRNVIISDNVQKEKQEYFSRFSYGVTEYILEAEISEYLERVLRGFTPVVCDSNLEMNVLKRFCPNRKRLFVDVQTLFRSSRSELKPSLVSLCARFGLNFSPHCAGNDAYVTFLVLLNYFKIDGVLNLDRFRHVCNNSSLRNYLGYHIHLDDCDHVDGLVSYFLRTYRTNERCYDFCVRQFGIWLGPT